VWYITYVAWIIEFLFVFVVSQNMIWKKELMFEGHEVPCIECMEHEIFVKVTTLDHSGIFTLMVLESISERVTLSTLNHGCCGIENHISQGKKQVLREGMWLYIILIKCMSKFCNINLERALYGCEWTYFLSLRLIL